MRLLKMCRRASLERTRRKGSVRPGASNRLCSGPAGVQAALLLQQDSHEFVVLERDAVAGSTFSRLPRDRKLISINKRHTGCASVGAGPGPGPGLARERNCTEFNLRHDWHSLLHTPLKMQSFSTAYYPAADDLAAYVQAVACSHLAHRIRYATTVTHIERRARGDAADASSEAFLFHVHTNASLTYRCDKVVVATGLAVEHFPSELHAGFAVLSQPYSTVDLSAERFEGSRVLLLGAGNSAFELANKLHQHTAVTHILGRSRVRLAFQTHYVGDVRAVNLELLDAYQLKSLDGITELASFDVLRLERRDNDTVSVVPTHTMGAALPENWPLRSHYDHVIRCLGFAMDTHLFDESCRPVMAQSGSARGRLPALTRSYESINVPGLYFVGALMHAHDHRRSSGGFVHGFRYLTRAWYRTVFLKEWPSRRVTQAAELADVMLLRAMESSGLYQMFGELCDVVRWQGRILEYTEEERCDGVHAPEGHLTLSLEYGAHFGGAGDDTLRSGRAEGDAMRAEHSNFLHPVVRMYSPHALRPLSEHHLLEDFLTEFAHATVHRAPLLAWLTAQMTLHHGDDTSRSTEL